MDDDKRVSGPKGPHRGRGVGVEEPVTISESEVPSDIQSGRGRTPLVSVFPVVAFLGHGLGWVKCLFSGLLFSKRVPVSSD